MVIGNTGVDNKYDLQLSHTGLSLSKLTSFYCMVYDIWRDYEGNKKVGGVIL